jgi:hypothetical protein
MVVADGQQSTRENRLTSWAEGLASTVEAQRHELRRSRMELVAAQEVPAAVLRLSESGSCSDTTLHAVGVAQEFGVSSPVGSRAAATLCS